MALSYPDYFPSDFLGPVVAAEAAAERQFRSTAGTPDGWADYRKRQQLQGAAGEYVFTLVLAFARQACAAVLAEKLSSDRVGRFVDDFERRASVHAYYYLELRKLWPAWESFRDDVIPKLHQSPGWLEHLDEREHCAISGKGPTAASGSGETSEKARRRVAVIEPLLAEKGLTRSKWAAKAGVDPAVVYDYLAGKSSPRPDNRKALAETIDLPKLPE